MRRILLGLLLFCATAAQAETYQWTDQDGSVHFSDAPGSAPAASRKGAQPSDAKSGGAGAGTTASGAAGQGTAAKGAVSSQVDAMKEQMMNDQGIMALVAAMLHDPDLQAILNDPGVMKAVQSGDIAALINNPAFMKLLDNPRVKEIENRMLQGGIQ
ncbi:MAG TPA: DUF4124 domain-containing protein [Geomonas sp.]|nr:DUF4124 domain-containing protein [Geomonas sp.]